MTGARDTAVAALIALAHSPRWRDRADAGHGLACFAEVPAAREVLLGLVLDAEDTAVTDTTAKALLRRGDAAGLAVVCAATAGAEDEQHDHLHAALWDVLGVFERDRDAALATCRALADDTAQDDRVRAGAEALVAELAAFQPVLLAGLPKVTAE